MLSAIVHLLLLVIPKFSLNGLRTCALPLHSLRISRLSRKDLQSLRTYLSDLWENHRTGVRRENGVRIVGRTELVDWRRL